MAEELKEDGDWVPVTPAKTVQEHSSVDSGKESDSGDRILGNSGAADACFANVSKNSGWNASLGLNGSISDKAEYEEARKVEVPQESISGFQLNDEQAHHNFGSDSTTSKASDTPGRPNSEKLGSCGVRLNRKKRPKVKKHRPRVFDETKPKKTPKPRMVNPLTPKQNNPRRSIPKTSPLEKRNRTRKENPPEVFDGNSGSTRKSCRRGLDFDHENHVSDQHGHDSCNVIDGMANPKVMETSFAKDDHVQMVDGFQRSASSTSDQTSHCAAKGLTDLPNACSESSLRAHSLEFMEDVLKLALEGEDFESCPRIGAIVQRYQRRKKNRSNPICNDDFNFEEKINAPEEGSKMQCATRFKVYKRIFRSNECLKNSRKLGPNFPRIFKKKRMKQARATKFQEKMDLRSKSNRSVKKILKRGPSMRLVDGMHQKRVMDNELSINFVLREYNLRVILQKQSQIMKAMADPKSFNCVWSLCPMANIRKKRSQTRSGKNRFWGMPEEGKPPEPQGYTSPLTWSVQCKRKRSNMSARRDLSSLCLIPTVFPSKAVVTEDCAEISVQHIPYLDAHSLVETPISVGQHLDLKHMFLNLNSHEVRGMTDFICQRFERLCISEVNHQLVLRDQKADGAIFPYEGKFDPLKRRKLLPKVDLDAETLRVWKLLMETDGAEDIGEGDDEIQKDWDNLREMFCGRIESFISCMHHIQGDRRFSPWKGSVVDSVIGVFLTQNVSDHLSSSAFMSLAAKFPPSLTKRSNSNKNNVGHQESVDINVISRDNEKPCQSDDQEDDKISCDAICYHEERTDVKYGDIAPVIPDSSAHKSSTSMARPCSSENASIFRQALLVEEDTFLQRYYRHEENMKSCDKSEAILNSGVSQSDTSTSTPDKISDLDGNTMSCLTDKNTSILKFGASLRSDNTPNSDFYSCLTRSQNLVADLGNININSLPNVGKYPESAGGRNKRIVKEKQESPIKWDDLRKQYSCGKSKDSVNGNNDSANWEAVRQASVEEVAKVIMDRGMNNILAGRIKDFLDRMIEDHGAIDLEWLRDVPPDKAKDYLLSIPGLGLKSTECVRLLTLRHHAFPVDTNVGRILVRLGWVPLLPLPEDVQIHLLNNYPLVDTIQKYIWPRLCKISNETLYECHYQMITFGKVFCTKRQPNCNACPMRGQCRHFASAYASARLRLPGVQGGSNEPESQVKSSQNAMDINLPLLVHCDEDVSSVGDIYSNSEPIIEFPPSPEPAAREMAERDIEDFGHESEDQIPTIQLNQEEFTKNLLDFMEKTNFLNGEATMSKELVVLSPEAASIPMPKLKFVGRLRTVHQVYEVPDSHPLLAGFEKREPDDPCPYLLAIWTNESSPSQPPKGTCSCQESITCDVCTCCLRDEVQSHDEFIQGTMLIPCRTANRGSFPLNGTYFQVNEVFADHESSRRPIPVPRKWIWNLRRRSLYCGTSTTSIFRGMTTDEIQYCFWRGFICVRATDRVTRAPRPLGTRFHLCKTRVVGDE